METRVTMDVVRVASRVNLCLTAWMACLSLKLAAATMTTAGAVHWRGRTVMLHSTVTTLLVRSEQAVRAEACCVLPSVV